MLIDGDDIIARQLKTEETTEVTFPDGRGTTLVPVHYVPQLADETMRVSLDGEWAVRRWPFRGKEAALAAKGARVGAWQKVVQPGPVFYYDPEENPSQVEGWDRVGLAHIDPEDGAMLRRAARIPKDWKGKRIYLRFDAIYPAGRVYLDGQLLGEHLSGLTPVEFDVTDLVTPGARVVVAVRLLRKHPFVRLDMPRHALEFAGLSQHAFFHATGDVHVRDYQLITKLDPDLKNGEIDGTVELENHTSRSVSCTLKVTLTSPDGRSAGSCTKKVKLRGRATKSVAVKLRSRNVCLWNDEFPNLYTVAITLASPRQETQALRFRSGFRRLDLSPKGAVLNGNPVKFRGVNHLTFHPEYGMYTPKPWLRRNLELMKKANVNAIRTHFLGPPALGELCDELGLYLLQELPIDWGTNYIHDPAWVGPILMRLEGGVRRDRHHPSLMVWSVGNENMPESNDVADDGWNHLHIFDKFVKAVDPSRHTMFPPPGPANKVEAILELRIGDVADTHYSFRLVEKLHRDGRVVNPRAWDATMEETTRRQALRRGWKGVWFSSEYGIFNMKPDLLNSPYLSAISDVEEDILSGKNTLQTFIDRLGREWGLMRADPTCLGGAYFPWLSAGAGKGPGGNPWGWVRWGEDADWGPVTADLLPKPFFWAMRALFSPVWIMPDRVVWRKGDKSIKLELSNQHNAIDLADCTLRTMMGGGGKWMGMMREYEDIPVRCKPGRNATVRIPIWNRGSLAALQQGSPACCRCVLLDPKGIRPITKDVLIIPEGASQLETAMPMGPDAVEQ